MSDTAPDHSGDYPHDGRHTRDWRSLLAPPKVQLNVSREDYQKLQAAGFIPKPQEDTNA